MLLKFVALFALLALSHARYVVQPKFYAQDSAVIVDTDKKFPKSLEPQNLRPQYRLVQPYPTYHILPALKPTEAPTPEPPPTAIENKILQNELWEIAHEKLGLKSIDEIPSISELGELLGTTSVGETMKYIRQLTKTEQGIALIKAYIESSDYTDSTGGDADDKSDILESIEAPVSSKPMVIPRATSTTPRPQAGFLDRVAAYLSSYGFLPDRKVQKAVIEAAKQRPLEREYSRPLSSPKRQFPMPVGPNYRPLYVRKPLPYHYPVPLRPVPHINTPKLYVPQLARIVKIPPKQLEAYLQGKPKLAELAEKVSRFVVPQERASLIDGQLLAAFERAIAQDDDLKKLLSSTETLK